MDIFTLIYFPSKTHKIPTKDMISLQKHITLVLPLSSVLHLSHQHYKYIPIHHLYNPPIKLSEEKQKKSRETEKSRIPHQRHDISSKAKYFSFTSLIGTTSVYISVTNIVSTSLYTITTTHHQNWGNRSWVDLKKTYGEVEWRYVNPFGKKNYLSFAILNIIWL